jgi:glycosyltransferase involved in cell wall biosynthesis
LRLCVASVADQHVELEHIVQDAGSDDGTLDWVVSDGRVKAFVEKDRGMYDAVNRGLARASGEICAYLNCDEQYLPGTLSAVDEFFREHPEIDVVFGDVVLTDAEGCYLAHRKMLTPLLYHTWMCQLSTLTCGMFFRARLVREQQFLFNPSVRDAGDAEWVVRLLRAGKRMDVLNRFTSVFTFTGSNMSASANATRERRELFLSAPWYARALRPAVAAQHRLRRFLGGMYSQCPFEYQLYTKQSPQARVTEQARTPNFRWPTNPRKTVHSAT